MGRQNLYQLTWIELFRLFDAAQVQAKKQLSVEDRHIRKFKEYEKKLVNG